MKKITILITVLVLLLISKYAYSQQSGIFLRGGVSAQTGLIGLELSSRINNSIPGTMSYDIGFAKIEAPYSNDKRTVIGLGVNRYFDIVTNDKNLFFQWYLAIVATVNSSVKQDYSSLTGTNRPKWGSFYGGAGGLRFQIGFFDIKGGVAYGLDDNLGAKFYPDVSIGIRFIKF